MALSESRKRANKKWDQKNLKRVNLAFKIKDYEKLKQYCDLHEITLPNLIKSRISDIIDN